MPVVLNYVYHDIYKYNSYSSLSDLKSHMARHFGDGILPLI